VVGLSVINKSWGLPHIDLFFKETMKKSILHIKLSERPTSKDCQGQKELDGCGLDHKAECILIVQSMALFESLCNQARFIALNGTISMFLHLEYPL
jgi:hypothetical protein